ncbi:TPA: hypothetical protein N0F65_011246, partial [Lagenidium giganteum]
MAHARNAAGSSTHTGSARHRAIEGRLALASDALLQRIAQFQKPVWKTVTVVPLSYQAWQQHQRQDQPLDVASTGTECNIEVLEGSTLADVRKLVATFYTHIPADFQFEWLHRQERGAGEEKHVSMRDAVIMNDRLVVLHRKLATKQEIEVEEQRSPSKRVIVVPQPARSASGLLPAFSLSNQFGELRATADIYLRKNNGVLIKLHVFSNRFGNAIVALEKRELPIEISIKELAARVTMTDDMVQILLSNSKGQTTLLSRVLNQLTLSHDMDDTEEQLRWQWKAPEEFHTASARELNLTRVKKKPQLPAAQSMVFVKPQGSMRRPPSVNAVPQPTASAIERATSAPSLKKRVITQSVEGNASAAARAESMVELSRETFAAESTDEPKVSSQVLRKTSMEVDQVRILRLCLDLSTKSTGANMSAGHMVQLVFTELVLHSFFCRSLPEMMREVRSTLKEVYRSASLSETALKSTEFLWMGLQVGLWEAKSLQFAERLRTELLPKLEALQQKFLRVRFFGFESDPMAPVPESIEAIVLALSIFAEDADLTMGSHGFADIVNVLGLHDNHQSKRRLRVFKLCALPRATQRALLPPSALYRVSKLAQHFYPAQAWTGVEETHFNASLLRDIATSLYDFVDCDLARFMRRSQDNDEKTHQFQSTLRPTLKSATPPLPPEDDQQRDLVMKWLLQICGSPAIGLSQGDSSRLIHMFTEGRKDNTRWYKLLRDCDVLASCSRPSRMSWFGPPRVIPADLAFERYIVVAEADLMFEWVYLDYSGPSSHESWRDLLSRAISLWIHGDVPTRPAWKNAFGLNYFHTDRIPDVGTNGPVDFQQIMATYSNLSLVVGSDSPVHCVLEKCLELCSSSIALVMAPQAFQFVLSLVLRNRLSPDYSLFFLIRVRDFLINLLRSDRNAFCSIMNQDFVFQVPQHQLMPLLPDNYDVFWLLSQSPTHAIVERAHAWELVCDAMIAPDAVTDYRMLCYSTSIPHERFGIEKLGEDLTVAQDAANFTAHTHYFNRITTLVTRTRAVRKEAGRADASHKFVAYACSLAPVDVDSRLQTLLNRLLAGLQSSIGLGLWNVDQPGLNVLVSIMLSDVVDLARFAAECMKFVARACTNEVELSSKFLQLGFADVLIDVLWATDDTLVGVKVASALAMMGSMASFRARIVTILGNRARSVPFSHRFMATVSPLLPNEDEAFGNSDFVGFEARYRSHVSQILLEQHRRAGLCRCWVQNAQPAMSAAEAIASFTKRYSKRTIDRVCAAIVRKERALKDENRMDAVTIRIHKASTIQRHFLRWMYVAKRSKKRLLPRSSQRISCSACGKTESLLATLLLSLGDVTNADIGVQNEKIDLLADTIACIRLIILDPHA